MIEAEGLTKQFPPSNIAARMGRWSAQHRKMAIFGWLGFVVLSLAIGSLIETNRATDLEQFTGESQAAEKALDEAGLRPNSEVVLLKSETLTLEDPEFKSAVRDVTAELSKVSYVKDLKAPLDRQTQVTEDGHAALVAFNIAGDSVEAEVRVEPVLAATAAVQADNPELAIEQFGAASAASAVTTVGAEDTANAGKLSLPLTLLILMVTFGSLVAAGVPLLIGFTSVLGAVGFIAIPSLLLPIDPSVDFVIVMIGLAVGVDYSLFYLRREREERAEGHSPSDSLEIAAATSGRAVLISGVTVLVAMAGMFISGIPYFTSFAIGTMIVVAFAMFASLTVLPAILSWLGDRVEKGRIPFVGRRRRAAGESRFWGATVDRVTRRPWLSITLAGGALVALAIPALHLKTVVSGVDDFLPQDTQIVQTYNLVKDTFPTEGVTTTVVVEATDVRSGEVATEISALQAQVDESSSFLPGTSVTYSADSSVAKIEIPTVGTGNDDASTNALNEVRKQIVPATVGQVDGSTVNVSGVAAQSADQRSKVNERLPFVFAFVFGLAFLLMLVTFRSIVIPIKAIVLNLLSVGAAYGVLVLVFQDGHGESLLGFTSNGGIGSWLPLFLFVVLFGLSMDYHVFILSRVREAYLSGMSTPDAVRHAISSTAGTVTSAALIMVGVFGTFTTSSLLDAKELGVGLGVAVLIDATIVRGVLLPASMKVLGDWNWYLPSWLEWLPRVGSEDQDRKKDPPPDKPVEPPKPVPSPV
ncbi:MAG: MMPL family transporter [Gaiellaceae bacterium]